MNGIITSYLTYIESIDQSIFLYINHNITNPFFDVIFPDLRIFTYIFWGGLIAYFWFKKERRLVVLIIGGIIAGAVFTVPVKYLIDRARPYNQIASTRLLTPPEPDPSFPSGHTELSFLVATIVSKFHPKCGKYLYAFSCTVALSRIYVGVHFPIDVVGGAIIGIIIGRLMITMEQRNKRKDIQYRISPIN